MIRKLVKHGSTTLITSLPTKWTKSMGLKKGGEINIEVKGNHLIISPTDNFKEPKRMTLDLRGFESDFVDFILPIPHKIGYDEVEVLFDDIAISRRCQKKINEMLLGYEITEQSSSRLLIQNISESFNFDPLLKRLYMITLTFCKEIYTALENGNDLSGLLSLEETVNKISNICERVLSTGDHKDKVQFLYLIVWNLESICDHFRDICIYITDNKIKVSESTRGYLDRLTKLLDHYFKISYRFDLLEIKTIRKSVRSIRKDITVSILKSKGETPILVDILGASQRIEDGLAATASAFHF
ncbi:hypothetical protein K9M79_06685 [Candidatus Woesearchaeota archaeon]|nr:hypothetical protein [Candidatus Woesearchaeota archaeon]